MTGERRTVRSANAGYGKCRNSRTGASFESGNAEDLAAKLRRVLELSDEERAALAGAGRRAVVERWSWERVAARLLQPFNN